MNPRPDSALLLGTGGPPVREGAHASRASLLISPFVRRCLDLPARVLLLLIRLYQRTLSPALPVLTLGACGCRFSPTCSHYAADAIRTHGALFGTGLALARLVKCTPLHPGGLDPVPPPKPHCERLPPLPRTSHLAPHTSP